jgi:hypothetical protein
LSSAETVKRLSIMAPKRVRAPFGPKIVKTYAVPLGRSTDLTEKVQFF